MPPRLYQRRLPRVRAIQWTGSNTDEVLAWCRGWLEERDGHTVIRTSHAMPVAEVGDYVVEDVGPGRDTRWYGMRKAIFEAGYGEVVE